jgi:hypothetical protein
VWLYFCYDYIFSLHPDHCHDIYNAICDNPKVGKALIWSCDKEETRDDALSAAQLVKLTKLSDITYNYCGSSLQCSVLFERRSESFLMEFGT